MLPILFAAGAVAAFFISGCSNEDSSHSSRSKPKTKSPPPPPSQSAPQKLKKIIKQPDAKPRGVWKEQNPIPDSSNKSRIEAKLDEFLKKATDPKELWKMQAQTETWKRYSLLIDEHYKRGDRNFEIYITDPEDMTLFVAISNAKQKEYTDINIIVNKIDSLPQGLRHGELKDGKRIYIP